LEIRGIEPFIFIKELTCFNTALGIIRRQFELILNQNRVAGSTYCALIALVEAESLIGA
jgi:hypothetical protein